MIFIETPISGAFKVQQKRISDSRGFFARGWCGEEFRAHGLSSAMIQLNIGFSHLRGTIRGMHFQAAPHAEAKFIRCTRGAVYDVVVDLRPESPTYGRWHGIELSAGNGDMLYVPEGCAHGYQTLEHDTETYYLTSAAYAPAAASGIRFDDPAVAIRWPLPVTAISEADQAWPDFSPHPTLLVPSEPPAFLL